MNVALWVMQVLTALGFGGHGFLETLGAIGVVVPAATGVLPSLTVAAAGGLVAMMLLAMLFHITRREWPNLGLNFVLGALAFAVAYGRLVIEPF